MWWGARCAHDVHDCAHAICLPRLWWHICWIVEVVRAARGGEGVISKSKKKSHDTSAFLLYVCMHQIHFTHCMCLLTDRPCVWHTWCGQVCGETVCPLCFWEYLPKCLGMTSHACLIHMCDTTHSLMPHSHVWHDSFTHASFTCVTRLIHSCLIHMCGTTHSRMPHSHVWHDSFTHSYERQNSFTLIRMSVKTYLPEWMCGTTHSLIHMSVKTHLHVWHYSLVRRATHVNEACVIGYVPQLQRLEVCHPLIDCVWHVNFGWLSTNNPTWLQQVSFTFFSKIASSH